MKKLVAILASITVIFCAVPQVSAKQKPKTLLCPRMLDATKLISKEIGQRYKIDYIMWRESKCIPTNFNPDDPYGGSIGLFQINQFWCKPIKAARTGWLQERGVIKRCSDLFKPEFNAKAFLAIYLYADDIVNDGWHPWS